MAVQLDSVSKVRPLDLGAMMPSLLPSPAEDTPNGTNLLQQTTPLRSAPKVFDELPLKDSTTEQPEQPTFSTPMASKIAAQMRLGGISLRGDAATPSEQLMFEGPTALNGVTHEVLEGGHYMDTVWDEELSIDEEWKPIAELSIGDKLTYASDPAFVSELGMNFANEFTEMQNTVVIWDEEISSHLASNDDLLQQLAQGEECLTGVKSKLIDGTVNDKIFTQELDLGNECLDNEKTKLTIDLDDNEMLIYITDLSLFLEQSMVIATSLQRSQFGTGTLEELGEIFCQDIIGSADMPYNLELQSNLLEESVWGNDKAGKRGTKLLADITANDIFDDLLDGQKFNYLNKSLINCEEMKGVSVYNFESYGIDTSPVLLGEMPSLGGFSLCNDVTGRVLDKMPAWRFNTRICHMKVASSVFDKIPTWQQEGFSPWSRANQIVFAEITTQKHGGKGELQFELCMIVARQWDHGISVWPWDPGIIIEVTTSTSVEKACQAKNGQRRVGSLAVTWGQVTFRGGGSVTPIVHGLGLWMVGPRCQCVKQSYKRKAGQGRDIEKQNQKLDRAFPFLVVLGGGHLTSRRSLVGGHGSIYR